MATTHIKLKDIDKDFWEQNKELSYMAPFAAFKKKAKSDKVMKAIYMIYDSKSTFRRAGMSTEEIIEDVNANFLNNKDFDWEQYTEIVEAYQDKCQSRLYKKLLKLFDEIDEIEQDREGLSWAEAAEAELRLKLMNASKTLFNDAITMQKQLDEEIESVELESEYAMSMIEGYAIE